MADDVYAVGGVHDSTSQDWPKVEKLTNSGWQVVEFAHWNEAEGFNSYEPFITNFGLVSLE